MSQTTLILEHLKKHKEISSWEAFSQYSITRLSSIIHILRHKFGYEITTTTVRERRYDGAYLNYAVYKLEEIGDEE